MGDFQDLIDPQIPGATCRDSGSCIHSSFKNPILKEEKTRRVALCQFHRLKYDCLGSMQMSHMQVFYINHILLVYK